ncbi:hypothetical protein N8944_06190, partial [Pseudomonadales bacterium]|nr:hypothetical protein [Pseudomonadales bacterium]
MKSPNFSQLQYLRVATASPVIAIGDPMANAKVIAATCQQLSDQGVAVGVFPELCLSGYSAEDLFYTETLLIDTRRALALLCMESTLPLIAVGAPWRLRDGRLINCAVLIGQGRILGMVPKSVQPNYGEFYDLRWFAPGGQVNETEVTQDLGSFQIRVDQLFEFDEHLIGVEICEDLWAPLTPGTNAALAGAHILLNLSASNELISKADYRRDLVRMTSAKN